MKTIQMAAETDDTGELDLHLVTDIPKSAVEILIMVRPVEHTPASMTGVDWRTFVTRFSGICADAPLERGPQGEYEKRDDMA